MAQSASPCRTSLRESPRWHSLPPKGNTRNFCRKRKSGRREQCGVGEEESAFLAENIGREKFNFDSATLRPYLPVAAVKKGLLETASKMFHVTFREEKGVPVWEPGVETWMCSKMARRSGGSVSICFRGLESPGIEENAFVRTGKLGKQLAESAVLVNLHAPTASDPGLMNWTKLFNCFMILGMPCTGLWRAPGCVGLERAIAYWRAIFWK